MAERDDTEQARTVSMRRKTASELQEQARKELEDAVVRAVNAGLTSEQIMDAVRYGLRVAEGA